MKFNLTPELESLIEEELLNELPIKVLKDSSVVYKNYYIKKENDLWVLFKHNTHSLHVVGYFHLKVSALMAANRYDKNDITKFNEIKNMDEKFHNNRTDLKIFQHYLRTSKDAEKRDNYLFRLQECKARDKLRRREIASTYMMIFNK